MRHKQPNIPKLENVRRLKITEKTHRRVNQNQKLRKENYSRFFITNYKSFQPDLSDFRHAALVIITNKDITFYQKKNNKDQFLN